MKVQKLGPSSLQKIFEITAQTGAIRLSELVSEMASSEEEVIKTLQEYFPEGVGLKFTDGDEKWVQFDVESLRYSLPLRPAEWLELHQIMLFAEAHRPHGDAFRSLKRKIIDREQVSSVMQVLHQLEQQQFGVSEGQQSMATCLEDAVRERQLLQLKRTDDKEHVLYALKVIHLEGQLSLIAEDGQDHCLMVVPLSEIHWVKKTGIGEGPRVTLFEIEDFIAAIRSMNEQETRLILKIQDPQSVNLFPSHHFLGKPCMIANPEGDLIWAAYVEPCEGLFDWLMSLGENVEILDPISFKSDFLAYCREKLQKIA